jgi:hypothetical protein
MCLVISKAPIIHYIISKEQKKEYVMMNKKPNRQLDLFSSIHVHWQRLSEEKQLQILEQLSFLLLSCIKENKQPHQTKKEDQPCLEK